MSDNGCTTLHPDSLLEWCKRDGVLLEHCKCTLPSQTEEHFAYGYRPYSIILLPKSNAITVKQRVQPGSVG